MKAVIIEDEHDAVQLLKLMIDEFADGIHIVGHAGNANAAIDLINETNPDLVFLDINLDGTSGFDVLESIDKISFKIIFTTAYDKYAVKAFRYHAVDYLLKPYAVDELCEAIDRVKVSLSSAQKEITGRYKSLLAQMNNTTKRKINFDTKEGIHLIDLDEIIHAQADRAYAVIYLSGDTKVMVSKSLKEVEDVLPSHIFIRTHRSHLVNTNFLNKIDYQNNMAIMEDGSQIPVARRKKEQLKRFLQKE